MPAPVVAASAPAAKALAPKVIAKLAPSIIANLIKRRKQKRQS